MASPFTDSRFVHETDAEDGDVFLFERDPLGTPQTSWQTRAELVALALATAASVERIQDVVGAFLAASGLATVTYNDAGNVVTIGLTTEAVQDVIGALTGFGDSGLAFTYDDAGNAVDLGVNVDGTTLEISGDALRIRTEGLQDLIGAFLAGAGLITVTYDDSGNAETISLTSEVLQDAIATFLAEATGINLTYDDAGNLLSIEVDATDDEISSDAIGELPSGSVRDQLIALEDRTQPLARLEEMKDGIVELRDYFPGAGVGSTTVGVGPFGWTSVLSSGTITTAIAAGGLPVDGYVDIDTGTGAPGVRALYRGSQFLFGGAPVFHLAYRAQVKLLNNVGVQDSTFRIGTFDGNGSADGTDGAWFQYDPSSANWLGKVADGGSVTSINLGVAVDALRHWFEIVSDGTGIHFLIDGVEGANSPVSGSGLPDLADAHGPQVSVVKTTGTGTSQGLRLSRAYLRAEE